MQAEKNLTTQFFSVHILRSMRKNLSRKKMKRD